MKDFMKHVPNILTVFRIICVPFLSVLIILGNQGIWYWAGAFILLILTGLSDVLDGRIARKFDAVTNLGKVLDPIADKLLQYACLVCLYIYGVVPTIVLPIIFFKEIMIGIGALVLYRRFGMVKGSSWYGKIYTVIYFAAIYITFIVNLVCYDDAQIAYSTGHLTTAGAIREYSIIILMYIVALAGIWSLIMYTLEYFRIRRRELARLSGMPQDISKARQAAWLRRYESEYKAALKKTRSQGLKGRAARDAADALAGKVMKTVNIDDLAAPESDAPARRSLFAKRK